MKSLFKTAAGVFLLALYGSASAAMLAGQALDAFTEEGIPGVEIFLGRDPFDAHSTVTDESGHFLFEDIEPGPYHMFAVHDAYEDYFDPQVIVEQGENFYTFAMMPLNETDPDAWLEGHAFDAETGEPLEGVEILAPVGATDETTFTDENGYYLRGELFSGHNIFHAVKEGYHPHMVHDFWLDEGANEYDFVMHAVGQGEWASLAGIVLAPTPDGELMPVPDALVEIYRDDWHPPQQTVTNDEGLFFFEELVAGPAALHVTAWEFQPHWQELWLEPGENEVEVVLEPFAGDWAVLAGLVIAFTEEGEFPVPGALVHISQDPNQDPWETWTNEEGHFFFDGLVPGPAALHVMHEDLGEQWQELWLEPGENHTVVVFGQNEEWAVLAGVVAAPGDNGEPFPLPGAMVQVFRGDFPSEPVFTNEEGQFFIDGLTAGSALLHVMHPEFHPYWNEIFLEPGENEIFVLLEHGDQVHEIEGIVLDRITREPVPGATLTLVPGDGPEPVWNAASNDDGYFCFGEIDFEAEFFILTAYKEGYFLEEMEVWPHHPWGTWVEVFMTPEYADDLGVLAGRVTFEGDGRPVFAIVEAFSADPDQPLSFFDETGPAGYYEIPVLAGDYFVACHVPYQNENGEEEWYTEFWDDALELDEATIIEVEPQQVIVDLDFGIPDPQLDQITVLVSGRVEDEDGEPISGAEINFWTSDDELLESTAWSDDDGYYDATVLLDRLPIVPFAISAESPEYDMQFFAGAESFNTATQFYFSDDGGIANVNFALAAQSAIGFAIGGRVLDEQGNPLSSALVAALNPDGSYVTTVSADAEGNFDFTHLDTEEVALLYYAPGHAPRFSGGGYSLDGATAFSEAEDGTEQDQVLAAVNGAMGQSLLVGTVRDEEGTPLAGAVVVPHTSGMGDLRFAFCDADGQYAIEGLLDAAEYTVEISLDGYYSASESVTTDSNQSLTNILDATLQERSETAVDPQAAAPLTLRLAQNHPNPFNPSTVIRYTLPVQSQVSLRIYDLRGALVDELVNGVRAAGEHRATFDGSGLASGLYFYQLEAGDTKLQGKMTLLK